ncbi:ANTAR domain-containing protein [Streptomyces maremycinicus]|uniref:ANTAR domain-containing protein n=1 Tax=Streptomyces maremycinicus TaxID=1679753 RepID=UPI00099D1611|nr:ANTAR domain-containing protein [Streptomyces sp. NBRC 110468]
MTTSSRVPRHLPDEGPRNAAEAACLKRENAQLRHAVVSHAKVDQALGVLVAAHRIAPDTGFEVLREVSQHTNIKLHTVAEMVIDWALGRRPLSQTVERELDQAVRRRSPRDDARQDDTPDRQHP